MLSQLQLLKVLMGKEVVGCKTTLKPRESPGGEIGKSLLRSPDQSCFSLPNAVMVVCRNSLRMGME